MLARVNLDKGRLSGGLDSTLTVDYEAFVLISCIGISQLWRYAYESISAETLCLI